MMEVKLRLRFVGACLAALLLAGSAIAQTSGTFQPTVGQQGKDVIWVPTAEGLVGRMLDTAAVTPKDYVIDLGSGDGRTVIAAAKRGAKALGIEYDPAMVELSIRNAAEAGVSPRASFMKADLFETDFSQATVLTLFLLPDINLKLRPKILDMKPGTRVVSNSFTMADWKADQIIQAPPECTSYCTAYFWLVPAKVGGTWRMGDGELTLTQEFQMVSGTLGSGASAEPVLEGRLKGDELSFTAGGRTFTGRVTGDVIEGTNESGGSSTPWRATRG